MFGVFFPKIIISTNMDVDFEIFVLFVDFLTISSFLWVARLWGRKILRKKIIRYLLF